MSDYHTPPSLKWLINVRSRQHGNLLSLETKLKEQITACESEIEYAKNVLCKAIEQLEAVKRDGEAKIQVCRTALQAIDTTISFHEIQIDPTWVKPVKSHTTGRQEPYGAMTRGIYKAFRVANGMALTTTQVTLSIIVSENMLVPEAAFQEFRSRVRQRLKHLCWEGKLRRLHEAKTQSEGRWMLLE